MKVEFYYSRATGVKPEAEEALKQAMQEAGVQADVEFIEVSDDGDARAKKCLGSPSIRINGLDPEYVEREPPEYHAGVRYYSTASGWKPYPKPEQMVALFEYMKDREAKGG